MRRFSLLLCLSLLLFSTSAFGDAVPGPPDDCPTQTTGGTDHYGPHCRPAYCKTDKDCSAGRTCQPGSLCVRKHTYESPRGNTYRVQAMGACGPNNSCPEGSTCETASFCAASAAATPATTPSTQQSPAQGTPKPAPQKSGGCSVSPDANGSVLLLFGLFLLFLTSKKRK